MVKQEHTGNYYEIKFIDRDFELTNTGWGMPEYRLKKVQFRNLDKYHRRK